MLRQDKALNAKLIFIEVIVNKPEMIAANMKAKRRALDQGEATAHDMKVHYKRVLQFQRMYVTLQDDGSEDDLSYIKLYDYGAKVVTNRMHGYLRRGACTPPRVRLGPMPAGSGCISPQAATSNN